VVPIGTVRADDKRVEALLAENRIKPLKAIATGIFEAAASWRKQSDDRTLLLARFS
jgi:hypothetical protein